MTPPSPGGADRPDSKGGDAPGDDLAVAVATDLNAEVTIQVGELEKDKVAVPKRENNRLRGRNRV